MAAVAPTVEVVRRQLQRWLTPVQQMEFDRLLGVSGFTGGAIKTPPVKRSLKPFLIALDEKGIGLERDGSLPDDGSVDRVRLWLSSVLSPVDMMRVDWLASRVTLDADEDEGGFIAYHGSAYRFDHFDVSRIGSGEGEAGLGEGVYLAGDPATARWYQAEMRAQDPQEAGYLYRVRVNVDPADLIAWDLPLDQQTPKIRAALDRVMQAANINPADVAMPADVINAVPGLDGSMLMLRNRISGVKYLDAFSRGKGSGTYNYVVFDPARIDILSVASGAAQ